MKRQRFDITTDLGLCFVANRLDGLFEEVYEFHMKSHTGRIKTYFLNGEPLYRLGPTGAILGAWQPDEIVRRQDAAPVYQHYQDAQGEWHTHEIAPPKPPTVPVKAPVKAPAPAPAPTAPPKRERTRPVATPKARADQASGKPRIEKGVFRTMDGR